VLVLEFSLKSRTFGIILPSSTNLAELEAGVEFSGSPDAVFIRSSNFDKFLNYENEMFEICKAELARTRLSGYRKFTNIKFELSIFDKEYRDSVFAEAFSEFESIEKPIKKAKTSKSHPLNQILFGPPGTGKTYHTVNKAVEIANTDFDLSQNRDEIKAEFDRLKTAGQISFVSFHQSMSYEDFVEGIKPKLDKTATDKVQFELKRGIFKQISKNAEEDPQNAYVLIIDEINRGNVAGIFGELITLIEDDKRIGKTEELSVTLPYSGEQFGVPANLHIIGTMNTADRSVEALDTALRRRFVFTEMQTKPVLLENREIEGVNLTTLLQTINLRIEKLLDRDHLIGHSFFWEVRKPKDLYNAFYDKIIPLLQEYFYRDYEKIGLILGEKFVQKKEQNAKLLKFYGKELDFSDFDEKDVYEIVKYPEADISTKFIDAVKTVYQKNE